ncbi:MAG: hypothetical protein HGA27_08860, partial [Peptococcaceae bacterium]|nr:hypothetical protein [Peptococcaceae bacterium]
PAWYFILSYLQSSNKSYLWTAFVCCGIIGLVHTIVFLFLIIGVVLLIFSHLLLDFKKSLLPVLNIALAGIAAGFLSVIPVLGGFLMGRSFHSASVEFLNNELKINFPIISLFDQISLAGILLFFIVSLFLGKSKKDFIVPLFLFLLLIVSFGMHMTLGPLTSKAVLSARSGVLWGILSPLGFGLGWYGITRIIPNFRKKMILEIIIFSIVISYAVFTIKPVPAEPYKMEYDSVVEQYLRISEEFRPTEWIIVSNEEGYSLAMGKGYHMMLGDFIKDYSPEDVHLSRRISGKVEMLTTPDIFIFKEKKMLQVKITGAENALDIIYNRRAREYSALDIWLEKYRIKHKNMTVYYEDQNIQVFQIHQPKTKKALFEELWEGR